MEGSESEASSEVRAAVGEGEVKDSDAGEAAAKVEYGPARREDVVNQDWESDCPLFMTKLPQDMEENPELLGLQNIMYGEEGEQATPLQVRATPCIRHNMARRDVLLEIALRRRQRVLCK